MKYSAILRTVVLLVCFSMGYVAIAMEDSNTDANSESQSAQTEQTAGVLEQSQAQAEVAVDANNSQEPNSIDQGVAAFEGLEKVLKRLNMQSRNEVKEWMEKKLGNRIKLAETVQKQISEELSFIRELAAEEGAVKTIAALDKLLADRQERFEKVLKKLEKTSRRMRSRQHRSRDDGRKGRVGHRKDEESKSK